ncbi:MAG: hypothetical protein U9Q99_00290 [Nanoarchaeota archaeon]|nr:hypothetical protein [Nanoarchaeota archaeon]
MKKFLPYILTFFIFLSLTKEVSKKEMTNIKNLEGRLIIGKDYYEFENKNLIRYIPEFEKLQEIKKDKTKIPFNICMHKSFAYYNLIQKDSAQLVRGYRGDDYIAHARVIISKKGNQFLYDPTWPNFKDGFSQEKDTAWENNLIFKPGITTRQYIFRGKDIIDKKFSSNEKRYLKSKNSTKVYPKAPSKDSLIKSIKYYSKKFK